MTSSVLARTSLRRTWLLTAGGFFSFFAFGFIDNLKGPTLPALLEDMSFDYAQGGTILLGAYLGFLIATLVSGVLADALGNRTVLVVAGLLLTGGLVGYSMADSLILLAVAMGTMGLGMGAIEVGGNGLIVELHPQNRGRYLNLLAVFHGIGSLLVPLTAAALLSGGFSWRQVFQAATPLAVVMLLFFGLVRGPVRAPRAQEKAGWRSLARQGMDGSMVWFYAAIALYVCAELGVAAWLVEFLEKVKGLSLTWGSIYLSLFFASIMVGRLVGSLVVERMGYVRAIRYAGVAATVLLAAGILGPAPLAILIPLSGLFFSIIFPTITALVSNRNPENTGTILGFLFAAGGVGGALGPWAIGVAGDLAGIAWAFALPVVYFLGVLVALSRVAR